MTQSTGIDSVFAPGYGVKEKMDMTEVSRLILGLRDVGWSDKKINDFLLYIESGDEHYKPTKDTAE